MQDASKFVGWNLSDGRNAHEDSTFINLLIQDFKVNISLSNVRKMLNPLNERSLKT